MKRVLKNRGRIVAVCLATVCIAPLLIAGCGQQQAPTTQPTTSPQQTISKIEQAPIPPEAKAAARQEANKDAQRRAARGRR